MVGKMHDGQPAQQLLVYHGQGKADTGAWPLARISESAGSDDTSATMFWRTGYASIHRQK